MNFGDALTHLRNSQRVSRLEFGYRYVYLGEQHGMANGPMLAVRAIGELRSPWFPTHEDLLADDWYLLPC